MSRNSSGSEYLLEKALPGNVDAERLILGAILLDNNVVNQAAEGLKRDDFFLDSHRKIYERMIYLTENGRGIDPITLADELHRNGELGPVGGPAYIASLIDGTPHFSNIQNYVEIVKGKSILRRMITSSNQIMAMCFDAEERPEVLLDRAEKMIFDIAEDRIRQGFTHISEIAHKQFEHIEQIAGKGQLVTGIASGFRELDHMTSGLQRGDMVIIAARPSMGKTAFALCIAQNAALMEQPTTGKQGVVGVFSLEMSKEQLVNRLLCSQARLDAHRLRAGILGRDDWKRLGQAVGELAQAQIFIDDTPGISVLELRAKARRLKAEQRGLDMLIIDYMQLMSGRAGRSESRQQEVSQISREIKSVAKELNVPILALSQLSRATETRTDHRPILADLRESGCLAGDSLVTLADTGVRVPIRELAGKSGFSVWALNEKTMRMERANVSHAFSTGVKPVFRLTTRLGRSIRATANHKFRTIQGWKRLDELQADDLLALPRIEALQNGNRFEEKLATGKHGGPRGVIDLQLALAVPSSQTMLRRSSSGVADVVNSSELMTLAKSGVYWDQILSVVRDGETEVFDLTVDHHHNFVANEIIAHNSIEQDADVVMFIYRDEVYHPETEKQNIAEIIIGKQRNGPIGNIELVFLKQLTRFENKIYEG
ncbi:MAG: replicative DNA helicase [Blastocatellia bacterium]